MENIIEQVVTLDTVTRYDCDGHIVMTPEDWNAEETVCQKPQHYRANVAIAPNGTTEITPVKFVPTGMPRYTELFSDEVDGKGVRLRQTQEQYILVIRVDRRLSPMQIVSKFCEAFDKAMGWLKDRISEED